MAAAIGSGLLGIAQEIEPDEISTGNAYERHIPIERQLPPNLEAAAEIFGSSKAASDLFGPAFTQHFAASRLFEARQFTRAVTDWELKRYFEIL
jgi:glutamine synthetase